MLRIYRRHEKRCTLTSKADPNCPGKVKCPVWITGTLQDGTTVKPRSLNTRNWQLASQKLLEEEAGIKPEAPKTTLQEAMNLYMLCGVKAISETWAEQPSLGTPIKVSIVPPQHTVTLRQVKMWVEKGSGSPKEMALRHRLKELLPG